MTCACCGRPATRTVALSLALTRNHPVCDEAWCAEVAGRDLTHRADHSLATQHPSRETTGQAPEGDTP